MASRTGIPTVIKVAQLFCATLSRLAPSIKRLTSEDDAVATAIDVALAACLALEIILEPYLEEGD